jgi:threonine aldolase
MDLVAPADSVMFCLSKGLSSPIGSILVGSSAFIKRSRHIRKMVGGGMRQVGVIAAAGVISLEVMTRRLAEDHLRARNLAKGLNGIDGLILDGGVPPTNMIYFNIADHVPFDETSLVGKMMKKGVQIDWAGPRRIRLVTHYWVDDQAVEQAVSAFREVFSSAS